MLHNSYGYLLLQNKCSKMRGLKQQTLLSDGFFGIGTWSG